MAVKSVIRKLMLSSASTVLLSAFLAVTPSFGLTVNHDVSITASYAEVSLFDEISLARRAMQEDVLDTYYSFYCFNNVAHNIPLKDPTYKRLTFKNSYSRIYPDTCRTSFVYTCPTCKGDGLMKVFQCNYQTR